MLLLVGSEPMATAAEAVAARSGSMARALLIVVSCRNVDGDSPFDELRRGYVHVKWMIDGSGKSRWVCFEKLRTREGAYIITKTRYPSLLYTISFARFCAIFA